MKCLIIQVLFIIASVHLSIAILYQGTICGWAEATSIPPILCNGSDPRLSCPFNYTKQTFSSGGALCYKSSNTTEVGYGLTGTLCGGLANDLCGDLVPFKNCPPGYILDIRHICYKSDPNIEDLSGTYCGIISQGVGSTCNNLPAGHCPTGYVAINYDKENWHACRKE